MLPTSFVQHASGYNPEAGYRNANAMIGDKRDMVNLDILHYNFQMRLSLVFSRSFVKYV